ncbi:Ig-like domain-containing protein [Calditrichota bacterium GD2]
MIKQFFLMLLTATILFAQDFSGIKIYINPGHGGNDPANDRYIPETGFWESESNLTKGLYLMELLQKHHATVYISRTQNREEDDLPLSQIDEDANAHNVDYFHSIHSNAYNATVNYPLLLFRGYDNDPVFPDAKRMGSIMFNEMNKADRQWTYWPYSWENNRGDWSFYSQWGTSGLGVLRYLTMPGTLSEGSFHDYLPNSFRLMSIDYRKHESIAILRSFIQYFGLQSLPDGVVAGIIRSKTEDVSYNYNYNSGLPNDKKKALNFARARLIPGDRIYVTDEHNNGFFMFENVEPGVYSVIMDGGEYAPDTVQVTVYANRTSYANGFLEKVTNKAPEVYRHDLSVNDSLVLTHSTIEIQFSQAMDRQSTESAFKIQPSVDGYFEWQNNDLKMVYALYDTLRRSTTYTVTVDTSAKNKNGLPLAQAYSFSFVTASEHVRPNIVNFGPTIDSVRIQSSIYIQFDFPMRREKTEAAFSIDPPVAGHFEWEEDLTSFSFVPDSALLRKTMYTVRLNAQAENFYGVALDSALQFTFMTRYRNELLPLKFFPQDGETHVSTLPQIYIIFNGVPNKYTVFGNVQLADSSGTPLAMRGLDVFEKDGRGVLIFEPRSELEKNMLYYLRLFPGMKDLDGLPVPDTLQFSFRTVPKTYYNGHLLDDFETNFGWLDPDNVPGTVGTDADATQFEITRTKKINGIYSGKLEYKFSSDSGGVCRLFNEEGRTIPSTADSLFGIWVYGDFSRNLLQLLFDRGNEKNMVVWQDTINWAGWKMLMVPLDSIGGSGDYNFHSVVVKQLNGGYTEGVLYLDDAQYDMIITALEDENPANLLPAKLALHQNYPNPFNPLTTIVYQIPESGEVQLALYNVLGQKIADLVKARQQPGTHKITIRADNLASGVYLYRLKFKDQVRVKKLIVLK